MSHPTMSISRFRNLLADAARANRGRPGRKGLPSKRVVAPQPDKEQIATLLFYKQTYNPDSNIPITAYGSDKSVNDFLKAAGLTSIAPIEDTPSYRRVRIKKTANFDIDSLKTFRIQGHEDILVITGRLLTPSEIAGLGKKAESLAPRKRTLRAAGVRVPSEGGSSGGSSVENAERYLANREKALADKGNEPLTPNEVNMVVTMYREKGRTKTAEEVARFGPKEARTALVAYGEKKVAAAKAAAEERAAAAPAPAPAPAAAAEAPTKRRGGRKPKADTLTPEEVARFVQLANGDINAGIKQKLVPLPGTKRWTQNLVKQAAKNDIAYVRATLAKMEASHAEDVAKAASGITSAPAPTTAKERAALRKAEAEAAAAAAAVPASSIFSRPFVQREPVEPPEDEENENEAEEEMVSPRDVVEYDDDDTLRRMAVSALKAFNIKANTPGEAVFRALTKADAGADVMARIDALRDMHAKILELARAKSLGDIANDPNQMVAANALVTAQVKKNAEEAASALARAGLSTGENVARRRAMEARRPTGRPAGSDDETRENRGRVRQRKPATLRAPRASKRFAAVTATQMKVEVLNVTLTTISRDLANVKRRLTLLKGKRTAQAKYARDQLQAEQTRLQRRIEKVEAQRDRAKAAVARAVKAANPKKVNKAKPLPQRPKKKGKSTKATTRRRSR